MTASPATSTSSTPPGPFDFAQGRLGSRRREYIGADPDKQAEAPARVEAYEKLVQVRAEMREVDHTA